MSSVWLVTGSSRGLGRQFVESALARGDRVVATARRTESLTGLVASYGDAVVPLKLDVRDRSAVTEVVKRAVEHFGRLDVVVNNAGHGLFGAVEEISEQAIRDQMETNFFGTLWVTQAVLPYLREQGSGHIVQISSTSGVVAFPALGGYHASKWAVEGLSESLAQEVSAFGIKVTIVEPGGYSTDWAGSSAVRTEPNAVYDGLRETLSSIPVRMGDPAATGPALLKIVDAENPPLRVFFGSQPLDMVKSVYTERFRVWEEWAGLSAEAEGTSA
ncbi:SDR family oxidoreductase [Streptomyces sp. NPDC085927]|uniref:SDR family oxidoreductase n=1 Tax=Streptomyces sp. NPDC085927 TaxID=3365738 RepID=UPI0037CF8D97